MLISLLKVLCIWKNTITRWNSHISSDDCIFLYMELQLMQLTLGGEIKIYFRSLSCSTDQYLSTFMIYKKTKNLQNDLFIHFYLCVCMYMYIYIYIYIFTHTHTHKCVKGSPYGFMAKLLDHILKMSQFELKSYYYIHFWTNAPWERYETPLSFQL